MVLVSFPSDQEHSDAVEAALTAVDARPHGYGEPVSEADYTLFAVTPRFGGEERAGGVVGTRGYRITILSVGRFASDVNEMRRRGDLALREQMLTVAGFTTSPIQFESSNPVAPDGEPDSLGQWLSAQSSYTYTV